nr:MAG: hypothetical protein [Bacteriophage sp.]
MRKERLDNRFRLIRRRRRRRRGISMINSIFITIITILISTFNLNSTSI